MYLTEIEIFSQQEALEKTIDSVMKHRDELKAYFAPPRRRFVFFGSGSSYMLAKSATKMFTFKPGVDAYAVASGDYLIDPDMHQPLVEDSVIVFVSRSGSTSEIIMAAEELKRRGNGPLVSVTMREGSKLEGLSDYTFALPWACDEGVSQTRSATNFYAVLLLISSIYDSNKDQIDDVAQAASQVTKLLEDWRPLLSGVVRKNFSDVVVLADGVLNGVGEEAALVFTEIALVSGKYFNLLDYRHGPVALNSSATLTIIVMQPGETKLQTNLINDIRARGGTTVVLHPANTDISADLALACDFTFFPTYGMALLCIAQLVALEKALADGINPDNPPGLSAWVAL